MTAATALRDTALAERDVRDVRERESWRYADQAALNALNTVPNSIAAWQRRTIPAETQESLIISPAPSNAHSPAPSASTDRAIERLKIHIEAGAQLDIFALLSEDCYRRLELEVTLADGAHFEFAALTIGGGRYTRECVTRVCHLEPNASSNQQVRAVHWGQAVGNFLGTIEVARDAQQSDATQDYRALLLEKGASANSRPALEILADDVKCAHGVAIGALDEQARFYLATRGLPPKAVQALLVRGFVSDIFEAVADETQRQTLLDHALAMVAGVDTEDIEGSRP